MEGFEDWNKNVLIWHEIINNMRYIERWLAVLMHKTSVGDISNEDFNTLLTAINNDCLSSNQLIGTAIFFRNQIIIKTSETYINNGFKGAFKRRFFYFKILV